MGSVDSVGGSFRLAELIDEYGEFLVGDFEEYYHRSLTDVLIGDKSPRYWITAINALPPGSRFVAQVRGGSDFVGWDVQTYLLANIIDGINAMDYHLRASHTKRARPPKPFWRPDQEVKRKQNNPFAIALRKKKLKDVDDDRTRR